MTIRVLQPGEALPTGHVCRCYDCAQGRFPPEESVSLTEAARGRFKVGGFPMCERVEIDGVPSLYVIECQAGDREPWALVLSEPTHRCQTCHNDRPCMHMVFPKRIDVTVWEKQRDLYEQVKARILASECECINQAKQP